MKYERPLINGTLIKRYKRFLADIRFDDGSELTVHCPNTGSMKRCALPGSRVWLSDSANPKRKYRYTWEWVEVDGKYRACVNTARPNQIVGEALMQRQISELDDWSEIIREPKVEDGRLDFCLLNDHGQKTWIEVKSVTLLEKDNGLGCFPDAVTERGLKHLRRLQALRNMGERAILLFCVPHEGIHEVMAARHIDPAYAAALAEVAADGVEVMAAQVCFSGKSDGDALSEGMEICGMLPVRFCAEDINA